MTIKNAELESEKENNEYVDNALNKASQMEGNAICLSLLIQHMNYDICQMPLEIASNLF